MIGQITPCLATGDLLLIQQQVTKVHVADALLDYIQDLLAFSRSHPSFNHGLSPRAGLAILNGARAWAMLEGRNQVIPEDVQAILPSTVNHRLHSSADTGVDEGGELSRLLLESVPLS